MATSILTADQLRYALDYDPSTGIFVWRNPHRLHLRRVGWIAGNVSPIGYAVIGVGGKQHYAHRLAWLYMYGIWPDQMVDHINGVKTDNRIENLRLASKTTNGQNMRTARVDNSSGVLGVRRYRNGKRFQANIKINGRQVCLGTFSTPEDAHGAYLDAKRKYHEGCAI